MLTNNVKQLFLFIFVGLIVVSCDNDSSNPLTPDTHTDAEGLILERDGTEVYREFEGSVVLNDLNLTVNDSWDLTVHFLDHDGIEIEHEEEEHDEGEEEDELFFTSYNDTIISLEIEEHCDEITDSVECNLSDHCEWHTDEGACEDEVHDDGDDLVEHHELGFELTGLSAGTTTFVLSLMHDGHADYTSLPISVTVTQE